MSTCNVPLLNGTTCPVRSISTPGFDRCPSTLPLSSSFQAEDDTDQESLDMVEALKKLAVSIEKTNCLLRKHTESLTFLRQTLFRAYSKSISSPTDRNVDRKVGSLYNLLFQRNLHKITAIQCQTIPDFILYSRRLCTFKLAFDRRDRIKSVQVHACLWAIVSQSGSSGLLSGSCTQRSDSSL